MKRFHPAYSMWIVGHFLRKSLAYGGTSHSLPQRSSLQMSSQYCSQNLDVIIFCCQCLGFSIQDSLPSKHAGLCSRSHVIGVRL
eukprot:scaffold125841_cov15-Prasinocladus_malaysianus.AAC.1